MADPRYRIYLAGPITNCNQEQRERWRADFVRSMLKLRNDVEFIDPAEWNRDWTPLKETRIIRGADAVVANLWKDSIGTTIGIMQAVDLGKPVVLIDPNYTNNRILQGILGFDEPARAVEAAAIQLDDILSGLRDVKILNKHNDVEDFRIEKLVGSVRKACAQAGQPEMLFGQYIAHEALRRLRGSDEDLTTADIRDAVFDVLDAMAADGSSFDLDMRDAAREVRREWEKKEERKSAEGRVDALNESLKECRRQRKSDRDELERLQRAWSEAAGKKDAPKTPKTLVQAVEWAGRLYARDLHLSDEARRGAKNSPFMRSDIAWQMLDCLGKCAQERRLLSEHKLETPTVLEWMEEWQAEDGRQGFEYAKNEKSYTRERYSRERTIEAGHGSTVCNQHLKWGSSNKDTRTLRIYFAEDPTDCSIWVGHIGRHLPI